MIPFFSLLCRLVPRIMIILVLCLVREITITVPILSFLPALANILAFCLFFYSPFALILVVCDGKLSGGRYHRMLKPSFFSLSLLFSSWQLGANLLFAMSPCQITFELMDGLFELGSIFFFQLGLFSFGKADKQTDILLAIWLATQT